MSRGSKFGSWNHEPDWRELRLIWQPKETLAPVTTRSGLTTADPLQSSSESETDPISPVKGEPEVLPEVEEEQPENMEEIVDNYPEIGPLNANLNGVPSQVIVVTPAQQGIDIKKNVLAVMPHFYGRKIECPYEFLHEYCKKIIGCVLCHLR